MYFFGPFADHFGPFWTKFYHLELFCHIWDNFGPFWNISVLYGNYCGILVKYIGILGKYIGILGKYSGILGKYASNFCKDSGIFFVNTGISLAITVVFGKIPWFGTYGGVL